MFNPIGTTVFTNTKKNFKNWPIVNTSNMNDYSQVDKYSREFNYAWLVNSKYKFLDSFNWNWFPESDSEHLIHTFPRCYEFSKKPANWDAVKLVPTDPNKRSGVEIKQPFISSYITMDFSVYSYSFNDKFSIKRMIAKPKSQQFRLIKNKKSFGEIFKSLDLAEIKDFVWLIDVSLDIDPGFVFDFQPDDENKCYIWNAKHTSSELTYPSNAMMLVSKKYIKSFHDDKETDLKMEIVDGFAGELNDLVDPIQSWIRAYVTSYKLLTGTLPLKDKVIKNKILGNYLENQKNRMMSYAADGCRTATEDLEKNLKSELESYNWLNDKFYERQKEIRENSSVMSSDKRLEIIKKIYGEDSEYYTREVNKLKAI
jgi:hypothetical protein